MRHPWLFLNRMNYLRMFWQSLMRVAALFSGGKDSTYSIYKSRQDGHLVECLITIAPRSEESMLLHYPNISATKLQAESMGIAHKYVKSQSDDTSFETGLLEKTLLEVKKNYNIEGLVQGGILSKFQKNNFGTVCEKLDLELIAPVWNQDQRKYMHKLLDENFRFIITGVSSGGLDDSWLGEEVDSSHLERLEQLSEKFGFNLNFEGGEAETFVIDSPVFSRPISIIKSRRVWDGYRGRFEIEEAEMG